MSSKKIRLRLYADENFPVSSSTHLKSLGISIIHAYDLRLINKNDNLHLKIAQQLKRTVLTLDRDFLYYSSTTVKGSFGVIVITTGDTTALHINKICDKALTKISAHFAKQAFIKVSNTKIVRIKKGSKEEIML
jgi:predicted nuclease of predicted toxin-antitoxin system